MNLPYSKNSITIVKLIRETKRATTCRREGVFMTITAAAIQFTVKQGDVDANLASVRAALHRVAGEGADLVVLPEMWSSGFAYKNLNELALRTERIVAELLELSARYKMVIVGSMPEPNGDKVFNSVHVVDNGALAGIYRKIHLFSLLGEDRAFSGGDSWLLADTSIGKIGVIVCYDLRFPELSRRLAVEGAEVICVPAQWPKPRQEHWRTLLRARAIENQLFVVACNACGMIGKLDFFGMSMIIDPKGELLAEGEESEGEIIAPLDMQGMTDWRAQIPCFNDRKPELY
ncbi:MAG: carbon-nitrogen family hydrolase [Proteobacteria bacterium]|nr:carbon-nitrogen family hydrolase [Pseudomonadota bacterium]